MRFTLNAFIVSTIALLSLATPVVNAIADDIKFTAPTTGQRFKQGESFIVSWTITDRTGLNGVNGGIGLVQDSGNPSVPLSPNILNTVPVLSGQGKVTFPAVIGNFYLLLLSADQKTTFGQSETFTIGEVQKHAQR